jgi:hypothetical protein
MKFFLHLTLAATALLGIVGADTYNPYNHYAKRGSVSTGFSKRSAFPADPPPYPQTEPSCGSADMTKRCVRDVGCSCHGKGVGEQPECRRASSSAYVQCAHQCRCAEPPGYPKPPSYKECEKIVKKGKREKFYDACKKMIGKRDLQVDEILMALAERDADAEPDWDDEKGGLYLRDADGYFDYDDY